MSWNPRFAAFARAHGMTPEQMHATQPNNARFMAWIAGRVRAWRAEVGKPPHAPINDAEQEAFDSWLEGQPRASSAGVTEEGNG